MLSSNRSSCKHAGELVRGLRFRYGMLSSVAEQGFVQGVFTLDLFPQGFEE